MIGILKALLGLSASVYTSLYVAFLEPHQADFLLLLAIGPSVMALLLAPLINFVPFIQVEPHTKARLRLRGPSGRRPALPHRKASMIRRCSPSPGWPGSSRTSRRSGCADCVRVRAHSRTPST